MNAPIVDANGRTELHTSAKAEKELRIRVQNVEQKLSAFIAVGL